MPEISELSVGDVIAEKTYSVTRDSLVRYAGASGDFNPIHYRDDVAAAVGLPGVLAHGMLTMGISIEPVVSWLADAGKVIEYGVRFTKPVVVPASDSAALKVTATVAVIELEAAKVRVDLQTSFADTTVLGKAQVWVQL
ncbi:MaoC family dehydratase [Aquiluna sp.]|jgi:acyl dehydratase|nr:MaoC family dehydratase [Aquiluna sp.]MDA8927425.1 MaoC family dehydratase [Aquiluna sp.]